MPRVVILGGGIIGVSTAYYLATQSPSDGDERLEIHIVESSTTLFASASGHAAGFLAKDWFSSAVSPLGEFSYDLHRQLAEQWGGKERWGWSESAGWSLDRPNDEETGKNGDPAVASNEPKTDLDWLMNGTSRTTVITNPQVSPSETNGLDDVYPRWLQTDPAALQLISERTTTGQVDPLQLCRFLLEQCLANGVILHHPARATKLIKTNPDDPNLPTLVHLEVAEAIDDKGHNEGSTSSPRTDSVSSGIERLSGSGSTSARTPNIREHSVWGDRRTRSIEISCDSLVIAAGCWTPRVYRTLFPYAKKVPKVSPLSGHSLILKSKRWPAEIVNTADANVVPSSLPRVCHAVFTSDPSGFSPEMFSRVGGDIWLGGLNSSTLPLPSLASDAHGMISRSSIRTLTDVAKKLCGDDVEVIEEALCFRPIAPTGNPIVAKVKERDLGEGPKPNGGVFLATGHGPWGISLSLGTGRVVSEMVLGKETSVNVDGLSKWDI